MESKEDKEFGDIFAGEERKLPVKHKPELNTPIEDKVVTSISNHIDGSDPKKGIQKPEASKLIQLLRKQEHTDFVFPPNVQQVYRGMGLTKANLAKMLKRIMVDWQSALDLKEGKVEGLSLKFTPLKPRAGSSWTIDFNTAFDFAKFVNKNEVIVILTANTQDNINKFLDLKEWYLQVDKNRRDEKEVVGLGTIIVNKIEWLIRS
jgi:hypothetical protein